MYEAPKQSVKTQQVRVATWMRYDGLKPFERWSYVFAHHSCTSRCFSRLSHKCVHEIGRAPFLRMVRNLVGSRDDLRSLFGGGLFQLYLFHSSWSCFRRSRVHYWLSCSAIQAALLAIPPISPGETSLPRTAVCSLQSANRT